MIERVEEGGLVLLGRLASALKLGRGAIVKRSFRVARVGEFVVVASASTLGERKRSVDTLL